MEAAGPLKMHSEQDGPPTSMNPLSHENFSTVVFMYVKKNYPPKTDMQCIFHKRKDFQSGNKDWVGIFRVGWKTTKEYYTWISVSSSLDNQVLFKAYYLPKDDEYYQFCYVDQNGEVRGVSTPFQFIVDENDIVIVTTQEEMENINEENETLKKKLKDLAEKNQTIEAQLCTITEKSDLLERENMDMRIQVQNFEGEIERYKKSNLELQLLQDRVKDLETDLKQKTMDLEESKAEIKQLQSENEAKQQAVENLNGLLDNCKKDFGKLKDTFEAQTNTLKKESGLKEELHCSLEKEKSKVLDLESNLKNTSIMTRKAEDSVSKLQQQLALQQEENAKLHADIAHLKANENELKGKHEENLRKMENDRKVNCELQESLNRQSNKLLESENKIRKLEKDLRCAQESVACIEQMLTKEQNESKKNKDIIIALKSTVELREEEVADLTESHKRKQAELDDLNSQFLRAYANSSTTSRAQGLVFGNPYEDIPTTIVPENESLWFGTRLEDEEIQTPTIQTCPICNKTFQDVEQQVYNDHVMCHEMDNYD